MPQIIDVPTPKLLKSKARALELLKQNPENEFHIISLHNDDKNTTAGMVFVVDAELAATGEVEQTHRLCTPEEIQAFKAEAAKRGEKYKKDEIARKANLNISVDSGESKRIADLEALVEKLIAEKTESKSKK